MGLTFGHATRSHFPTPDSRFPTPYSRLPTPYSLFKQKNSRRNTIHG
ncbi:MULTISPECIES: hypothetical protein [Moorena]|nr:MULTISPECIES: hypothetical protein [Moorena]NEP36725.1 hypothetical protein [Moorena sp. SIO3B2]NEP70294.1 hypothetical protein [Moorena sp. SIO3A5]NER91261.1 hypothetical protein [Moorena sp. SIO3A2]NES46211.1 hypothetical protein [Moorena sp. SIO2C4]